MQVALTGRGFVVHRRSVHALDDVQHDVHQFRINAKMLSKHHNMGMGSCPNHQQAIAPGYHHAVSNGNSAECHALGYGLQPGQP